MFARLGLRHRVVSRSDRMHRVVPKLARLPASRNQLGGCRVHLRDGRRSGRMRPSAGHRRLRPARVRVRRSRHQYLPLRFVQHRLAGRPHVRASLHRGGRLPARLRVQTRGDHRRRHRLPMCACRDWRLRIPVRRRVSVCVRALRRHGLLYAAVRRPALPHRHHLRTAPRHSFSYLPTALTSRRRQ